ncbi:aspartyl protease family protein [Candidatus Poriferisocius sp.]|uniref:aspartyl protease family protein n=1 Tax=Candidatus Poriferisocius sp. TaxID=3101276 RepID=UPI003B011BAE
MGIITVPIQISAMEGGESIEVEAIVDTGSFYTMLPDRLLRELGVKPVGTRRIDLADGRRILMNYGRAWVTVEGESEVTLVAFGEDDGPVLLGAYTLQGLALAVDPAKERLVPSEIIMYRAAS